MAQSDRVTDLIMHYYLQHGRNRDLEKYLRLRRLSSATRSSSDGSLPNLCPSSGCAAAERSGAGRSMENLSTLRQEAERQEVAEGEQSIHRKNASAGSGKSSNNSAKQADGEGEAVGGDAVKGVTVREKKVEQKSGRNFNFNLESVIEINLPPPPNITIAGGAVTAPIVPPSIMCSQMAAAPLQPAANTSAKKEPPLRLVVHENSTQTPVTPEDDPIRPVVKPSSSSAQPGGGNEETLDSTKDLSPGSSVASNRQKLEWDSLGDIGYDSSERLQFCGAADLNETEKRCLQRYFARKGLTFDRSVVVVRQREEKERKVAAKAAQQEVSIVLANPGAQSTPKPSCSATVMTAKLEAAKATQTSLRISRALESRGVQAVGEEQPQRDREDKGIGTESCTMASVDAAESFEFFPRSAPGTGSNGGTSVASLSTTSHHSSSTTSSSGDGPSSATLKPTFDDEVKLGLTLYNSIQELSSMPTGVKQSLIDKIFRKLTRHDPKKRTREQLLRDYATAVRERRTGGSAPPADQANNVYDDVSPSGEHDVPSGSSFRPEEKEELDRSLGVEELVVDETKDPEDRFTSEENVVAVEGSVQGLSSGSNDAQNAVPSLGDIGASSSAGGLCSIQTVSSSHQESVGTAKENVPESEPAARDKRVRKAMQDYLRPMTQSEVEYENFKELQKRAQRAKEPQLALIDREIEQLLVRKMLLLSADTDRRTTGETGKGLSVAQQRNNALPSERSGTVYTSVHESTSGSTCGEPNSSGRASKDSSAWNSHYHMAKVIKTRSKLETPTSPSDVSIPTFIKQKKDQFIDNYDQVRRERRAFEEQNHIYTRPYSGQRSDAIRRQEKENRALARGKYVKDKLSKPIPIAQTDRRMVIDSSSNVSVPSPRLLDDCAAFISSDSISIPVVTTLTNTTTTHHYDIKSRRPTPPVVPVGRTAGTQTTDSILRTKPIFGEQRSPPQKTKKSISTAAASIQVSSSKVDVSVNEANGCRRTRECHCMCGRGREAAARKTELIDGTAGRQDKQAQTKPSSIAYVITFEGGTGSERHPSATSARTKTERSASPLTVSSSPTASVSESDEGGENGKDNVSEKMLTLREQFSRSCPTTLTRIEERRRCIGELNKLRSKRNAQRQRLLLLTSDDSLRRAKVAEGKSKLPPPPLTSKWRVFTSTRAMRENTRRQVRNLPEVLRKKELERMNNLKRKNLIMKDVYNRNLQRKVLRGQVDLSNSVRVIQD
ncbi:Alstrom syndrome protein 1 homolog a-like [Anopheles darlingi]|uniref:Alstrom syndrome protein 1 homolog a-like n=1 Tax=Anopheles darlingi TaxID=43151 RepID=UPI00210007A8|nr:Alstrom syndrome protein 1 homolog a-like [Anopheles darlingi]